MGTLPFPSIQIPTVGPSSAWNPANPQGSIVSISGTYNNVATFAAVTGSALYGAVIGVVGRSSGRWYYEVALSSGYVPNRVGAQLGISPQINTSASAGYYYGRPGFGIVWATNLGPSNPGLIQSADLGYSFSNYPNAIQSGVLMCAVDLQADLIWWGFNGAWAGYNVTTGAPATGNPATGAGGIPIAHTLYYPGFQCVSSSTHSFTATLARGGLSGLAYAPPTGFSPWN